MTLLKLAYATQRSLWWSMVEFPGAAYDMFNDGSLVTLCEPLVVCFTATDYDDYGNYRFCPLSLWNLWLTALKWWFSTISYVELPERFQLVVYDVSCFPSTCLDGDFPQVFLFGWVDSRQMLAVIVCVDMFEHGVAQDLIWLVVWNIFYFP